MRILFCLAGFFAIYQPQALAAPLHHSVLADRMAKGDTCGLSCPSGVGQIWSAVSARLAPPAVSDSAVSFFGPSQTVNNANTTVRVAVLLAEFPDKAFSGIDTQVGDSVRVMMSRVDTYYRAISYNRMRFSYTVFDSATQTVSKNQSNYDDASTAAQTNHLALAREVLALADSAANYGSFDIVVVLHAGVNEQLSGTSTDLSAQFLIDTTTGNTFTEQNTDAAKNDSTRDTVNHIILMAAFGKVSTAGETITTLGTLCHELGHAFGLPDLYSTGSGAGGVGDWSLMGSGNYSGRPQGDSPAWMDPWCREYLGWAETVVISAGKFDSTFGRVESDSRIYKIKLSDTEYFLFEDREPNNSGVDSAPGSGLLIWHIDNTMGSVSSNNVNNLSAVAHRRVDLEEADGSDVGSSGSAFAGTAAQPWPGSGGKTEFGDNSSPSSRGYSDTIAKFAIRNIAISNSISLTLDFTDVTVTASAAVRYPASCLLGRIFRPWPAVLSALRAVRDYLLGSACGRSWVECLDRLT